MLVAEADIVINLMPPFSQVMVARDCIRHRRHMFSVSYRHPDLECNTWGAQSGLGWHDTRPGLIYVRDIVIIFICISKPNLIRTITHCSLRIKLIKIVVIVLRNNTIYITICPARVS